MGFSFRKSLKIGIVRINISKSGVGGSMGVKGARIGVNAKGKGYSSLSIPGTGIRYTSTQSSARQGYDYADDDHDVEQVEHYAAPVAARRRPGLIRRAFGTLVMIFGVLIALAAVIVGTRRGFTDGSVIAVGIFASIVMLFGKMIRG